MLDTIPRQHVRYTGWRRTAGTTLLLWSNLERYLQKSKFQPNFCYIMSQQNPLHVIH